MFRLLLVPALLLALVKPLSAQMTAQGFVDAVTQDGLVLTELSQQALDRSPPENVAALATEVIAAHRTNAIILDSIVQEKGLEMPDGIDPSSNDLLAELGTATEDGLPLTYATLQVQAHERAIEDMRRYIEEGKDDDLKRFAEDTLRTLEGGLREAQALSAELGDARE